MAGDFMAGDFKTSGCVCIDPFLGCVDPRKSRAMFAT
jgi:hypothetical protein